MFMHLRVPMRGTIPTIFVCCVATLFILFNFNFTHGHEKKDLLASRNVDLAAVTAKFVKKAKDASGREISDPVDGVSVVRVDNNFLFANYLHIYICDRKAAELRQMEVVLTSSDGISAPESNGNRWAPTGLAYDKSSKLLYVANYRANNILYFAIDVATYSLSLKGVISSASTISPENVALSSDGRYLVSANYDGNSITAFHRDHNGRWREAWVVKTRLGHGVAVCGSTVFATSLGDRKLMEIGLFDGKVRRSIGGLGWDPGKPEFLWPTAVAALDEGRLAVADAHTGRITILQSDTLQVETWFGANGPGWQFMNMPYAVVNDAGQILIMSVFQRRMIAINGTTFQVTKNIVFGSPRWNNALVNHRAAPFGARGPDDWDGYKHTQGPQIDLAGIKVLLSYRHVFPVGHKTPAINMAKGVLNFADEFYFLQASILDKNSVVFTSPQVGSGVFYTNMQGITYGVPVCSSQDIAVDTWEVDNQLVTPFGPVNMTKLNETCHEKLRILESMRSPDGILSRETLFRTLASGCYDWPGFNQRFTETFISEPGKQFIEAYKRWELGKADAQTVRASASAYFGEAPTLKEISMAEFTLVQMIAYMPASLARNGRRQN